MSETKKNDTDTNACCSPEEKEVCCAPQEKAACCAPSAETPASRCGC